MKRAARLARGLSVLIFEAGMFLTVREASLGQQVLILKGSAPDLELSPEASFDFSDPFNNLTELIPTTTDDLAKPAHALLNAGPVAFGVE